MIRKKGSLPRPAKQSSPCWNRWRVFRKFQTIHPVVIPVTTFCVLLLLTLVGYMLFTRSHVAASDSYVVIISHDKAEQTVPTKDTTVGALLKKLNIRVGDGDVVEPAQSTEIKQDDFRINVYRAVPVEVIDNGRKTFTFSAATTPRTIAKQAGSTLYAEDALETKPVTNFLADGTLGEQVVIQRATPVTINLYGDPVALRTRAKTVGELLQQKGIKLGQEDSVQPTPDTPLTPQAQVFLLRKGTQIASVSEAIAMPIQVINDPSLAFGTSAVRQQGSPGQKVTTYQINTQNGKEVSRSVLQSVISRDAVTQIVVQGSSLSGIKGDMALAGIAPGDYNYADYIISHESGWCPTKAQGQYGGCPAYNGSVPAYGGYGLCQATPGSKMASAGADWATNPVTQLRWCSGYAQGRYGGWGGAYNHWLNNHNW